MKDKNKKNILERLKKNIVLGAEGYVFELERRGYIKSGPYVPEVVLDFPQAVEELHREFLLAGSEVMVALTYYAHREKLKDVGRENDLEKMNRQAVRIANKVATNTDTLVAGNVCNTWVYDPENKKESSKIVRAMYEEQIGWAVEEGIDFVISETNDYLGEALIALEVIKKYNLPAMITLASVQKSSTRDGFNYIKACKILEANGADIVGLNCDRGPATMLPIIEKVRKAVNCYVAAQPVPYRTNRIYPTFESLKRNKKRAFPLSLESFLYDRFAMADFAKKAKEIGVNYIGVCCGNSPAITRSVAEALGRTVAASKYSPAIELHPMIGNNIKQKDKIFVDDWKGKND
ncbi:MAG TPA: homocysteine S-methyltransferase family protein [Candidatus Saccharimonadales bacterium]|nr:homocysteine S-methyltransferase family protein [Candidatus Saccharimonadales bacterium]